MSARPDVVPSALEEKIRALEEMQKATLNILADFDAEKNRLEDVERASFNILEDFDSERDRLRSVERILLNILEDSGAEKDQLQVTTRALSNILDDLDADRRSLQETPRALLNMLEDLEAAKSRVEEANQQLQRRSLELQTANQELEAFSYSVSHDLRAPLRHVSGFAGILVDEHGAQLNADARRLLEYVQQGALQMTQLVDDLLNLSRIGRQQLVRRPADLNALVEGVLADVKVEAGTRQIRWQIQDLPAVECDPGLVKQVFANLLSNAVKFTRTRPSTVIEVGHISAEREQTVFFVRDNGVGFNQKYADKLFGAFQRLHAQEEYEGTGVGLATVHRIVRKHGGRVWAEAEVNKGAAFYFTLGDP